MNRYSVLYEKREEEKGYRLLKLFYFDMCQKHIQRLRKIMILDKRLEKNIFLQQKNETKIKDNAVV